MILPNISSFPAPIQVASRLSKVLQGELSRRTLSRAQMWIAFWMSPGADPIAIAAALETAQPGSTANFITASAADVTMMTNLATALGVSLSSISGSAQYLAPPAAYSLVIDGAVATITLNPGWTRVVINGAVQLQGPNGAVINP